MESSVLSEWIVPGHGKPVERGTRERFRVWFMKHRTRLDLTQVQTAAALGTTQQNVSLWSQGKRLPTRENLVRILRLFSVDERTFMEEVRGY